MARRVVSLWVGVEGQAEPFTVDVAEIAHVLRYSLGRRYGRVRVDFPEPYEDVTIIDGLTLTVAEAERAQAAIAGLITQERARRAH